MFFALTDDQREFAAAVRGYLAERFDLAAVRGVVEDADSDGNPASLWKAAGERAALSSPAPRACIITAPNLVRKTAVPSGIDDGPREHRHREKDLHPCSL